MQALVFDVSDPRGAAAAGRTRARAAAWSASYLSGGVLYLVTAQDVTGEPLRGEPRSYCPTLYDAAGEPAAMAAEDVHVRDGGGAAYTVVTAIDVSDGSLRAAQAILGGADAVYLNGTHLLVAWAQYSRTQEDLGTDAAGRGVRVTRGSVDTALALVFGGGAARWRSRRRPRCPAVCPARWRWTNGTACSAWPRRVEQWEAREYDDGTDAGAPEETRYACVYTLDAQLQPLGSLERLAEGAWIGSVRFAGPAAYLTASPARRKSCLRWTCPTRLRPRCSARRGTPGLAGLPPPVRRGAAARAGATAWTRRRTAYGCRCST